ncbi:MAG: hypothetical protein QXL15_03695 [Candidatus Korarchaeota archaeon]
MTKWEKLEEKAMELEEKGLLSRAADMYHAASVAALDAGAIEDAKFLMEKATQLKREILKEMGVRETFEDPDLEVIVRKARAEANARNFQVASLLFKAASLLTTDQKKREEYLKEFESCVHQVGK